jgi:class 3 adenylate cyclase
VRPIRRLVRLGLDPALPVRQANHVILTNAIALIAIAQLVPLVAVAGLSGLRLVWPWIVGCILFYLSVLVVSQRGRVIAARIWLALVSAAAIIGGCALLGPDMRVEVYLLVAVAGAWNTWSSARNAMLVTLLFVASWVVVLVLYSRVPPLDPAPVALAPFIRIAMYSSVVVALIGIFWWSHRQTTLTDEKLDHEHARSERLLRNVLPDRIAERLKDGPITVADRFEDVTVLFADVVGFTAISATLPPERVVELLNRMFTRFDELAAQHRVEKIKTIGDAYMVVAGLPERRADHAEAAARMALDLREAVVALSGENGEPLQIRIGLCSGPAVAGVIGIQKFAYDLWGDTVNMAARMESHGMAGAIQVTESTYTLLRDRFAFEERGLIDVKGKGPMRAWLLVGPRASG